MIFRISFTAGNVLLHKHIDGDAIFGMHHDCRAIFTCRLHRSQDLRVIAVKHAWIGHEQLETGDTFMVDQIGHVLQCLLVNPAKNLMKGIIHGTVAAGLAMPLGQALMNILAIALECHVDDRGDPAPCRGRRSGFECVAGRSSAKR